MNQQAAFVNDDTKEQPKVLLVDDDEVNLLLTSIALRERGFAITEASSGEKALRMLADWSPDVIVLDARATPASGVAAGGNSVRAYVHEGDCRQSRPFMP